jgi:phosphate transport system permease protein
LLPILPKLPTSIFDQAMALPYHLYVISTSGTDIENQERWLMVLVLIIINNAWRLEKVKKMN